MDVKIFESKEKNVWKYVFSSDKKCYEAVLYKYNDFYERTVICCSVMSGCPVGCKMCGTGNQFIGNLTAAEITFQIEYILNNKQIHDVDIKGKRFQIMFMSMGEPMLNWKETSEAIQGFSMQYPNAELLISTIGIDDDNVFSKILQLSKEIDKIGLQFSIHEAFDYKRDELIPYKNKWTLKKIRDAGIVWWNQTGRKPYLNYCITGINNYNPDFIELTTLFSPVVFNFTFSVVCNKEEQGNGFEYRDLEIIHKFENEFLEAGYNARIFDPAGQDDIGGGCGMLWYVQKWMKEHK